MDESVIEAYKPVSESPASELSGSEEEEEDTPSLSASGASPAVAGRFPFRNVARIPFADARLARIAARALAVDKEVRADKADRCVEYIPETTHITVTTSADSLSLLRTIVNVMYSDVISVQATMDAFP